MKLERDSLSNNKVLVVDDDKTIRQLIEICLRRENIYVTQSNCGETALELLKSNSFDLVILDILMGDMDGYEVLTQIRKRDLDIPVIILSGRDKDYDKVLGFGIGADDYVTKPFRPVELCARVKSHIRKYKKILKNIDKPTIIEGGPLKFDTKTYTLYKESQKIDLSSKEKLLMKFFMENPNQVFTKEQIYKNVWGDEIICENSVMVYISYLRNKLENNPKSPVFLQTIWGIGYSFRI